MPTVSNLPIDGSNKPIQLIPAQDVLAEDYDESISSSTEFTFHANARIVELVPGGEAVMMKWGTSNASTSDWSHVLAEGVTRHLFIPIDTSTGVLYTAVNFIERTTTAWISMGQFA